MLIGGESGRQTDGQRGPSGASAPARPKRPCLPPHSAKSCPKRLRNNEPNSHKREEAAAARARFASRDGDHLTLLAALRGFLAAPKKQRAGWAADNFVNMR